MNQRTELLPGVYLRVVPAQKFKTACMSVNFLQPLSRQTAPVNALLPSVLLRGTRQYPGIRQISEHLDDLYGASLGTLVRKKGDVVTCGLYADFIEDQFVPDGSQIFDQVVDFIRQVLFEPVLEGEFFAPDYVEGEKENLIRAIRSRINDKRTYAMTQMLAAMCADDPCGVPRLGDEKTAAAITGKKLMQYYQKIQRNAPIEIFYLGRMPREVVEERLRTALQELPNRRVKPVSGAPMQGNPEKPRFVTESLDVTQGKLCMGLRTNCSGADPAFPALQLLNVIFGSGISSKLFLHVREELSLCYYAASSLDRFKGLMTISSGVEFDQRQRAQEEILRQLDACKDGQITWDELETARRYLLSAFKASLDAPGRVDDFYLGQTICGDPSTMEDRMRQIQQVTLKDVVEAANRIHLDTVYFLEGGAAS